MVPWRGTVLSKWFSLFAGKCPVVLSRSPRLRQVLCGRTRLHEEGFSAYDYHQVFESRWPHGQDEPRENCVRGHVVGVIRGRGVRWFPFGRRRRDGFRGTRRWLDIRHHTWSIDQWEKPYNGLAGVGHVIAKTAFLVGRKKVPRSAILFGPDCVVSWCQVTTVTLSKCFMRGVALLHNPVTSYHGIALKYHGHVPALIFRRTCYETLLSDNKLAWPCHTLQVATNLSRNLVTRRKKCL